MKFAGSEYKPEELVLLSAVLLFFLVIFAGSFAYEPEARLFPIMLSGPGIVLLIGYLVRGRLPGPLRDVISGKDGFGIGRSSEEQVRREFGGPAKEKAAGAARFRVYIVFCFTAAYIAAAYLGGYYLATILALAGYIRASAGEVSYGKVGGVLLILGHLAMVYVFDTAFGYHFEEGVLFSFPPGF